MPRNRILGRPRTWHQDPITGAVHCVFDNGTVRVYFPDELADIAVEQAQLAATNPARVDEVLMEWLVEVIGKDTIDALIEAVQIFEVPNRAPGLVIQ